MQPQQSIEQYLGQRYAQDIQNHSSGSFENRPEVIFNSLSILEAFNRMHLQIRYQRT